MSWTTTTSESTVEDTTTTVTPVKTRVDRAMVVSREKGMGIKRGESSSLDDAVACWLCPQPLTRLRMEVEVSSPVDDKEWSPKDDEDSTLDLLKPVEAALHNSVGNALVGEFVVEIKKVNGSLGFTLRQTDDTILRHSVKVVGLFIH